MLAVRKGADLGRMVNTQLDHLPLSGDHAMMKVGSMGNGVFGDRRELCLEVLSEAFHLLDTDAYRLLM